MTVVSAAPLREGMKSIARESGEMFGVLAARTRSAIGHANESVIKHGGFRGAYAAAYGAAPVTTALGTVAAGTATVGGVALVGGHMARSLSDNGRSRSQENGR